SESTAIDSPCSPLLPPGKVEYSRTGSMTSGRPIPKSVFRLWTANEDSQNKENDEYCSDCRNKPSIPKGRPSDSNVRPSVARCKYASHIKAHQHDAEHDNRSRNDLMVLSARIPIPCVRRCNSALLK